MVKKKVKILEYNAVFTAEEEGGFSVFVPDLQGCISEGETFEEAVKNIKEAIELYLDDKSEDVSCLNINRIHSQFLAPIRLYA